MAALLGKFVSYIANEEGKILEGSDLLSLKTGENSQETPWANTELQFPLLIWSIAGETVNLYQYTDLNGSCPLYLCLY